jgi:hypothetical protein
MAQQRSARDYSIRERQEICGYGRDGDMARARPKPTQTIPCLPMQMMFCNQIQTHMQMTDNFFDGIQGVFRVGEGTPFDSRLDRFFGVK